MARVLAGAEARVAAAVEGGPAVLQAGAAAVAARDCALVREAGTRKELARLAERRRVKVSEAAASEADAVAGVRARLLGLVAPRESEVEDSRREASAAKGE